MSNQNQPQQAGSLLAQIGCILIVFGIFLPVIICLIGAMLE